MYMFKYILKRVGLMLLTFTIIFVTCFVLVKLLPINTQAGFGKDTALVLAQLESRGYFDPIPEQFFRYVKRIVLEGDFGIGYGMPGYQTRDVWGVFVEKLPPTVLINIYSSLFAVPLGILLGILAALKKNKLPDHLISTAVMVFISVPSFVVSSLLLYFVCFKFGWLPKEMLAYADITKIYQNEPIATNETLLQIVRFLNNNYSIKNVFTYTQDGLNLQFYFNKEMFLSMLPAVFAMSFGSIAGYARFTRAELTEVLTSEFMLLARTKGLTKAQATTRHALRNSMVPIFPSIVGEFISVLSGSLIIESIFGIPGVGGLYLDSINNQAYDFFMLLSGFYLLVGLAAGLVIDLSYGVIDPRIRMGAK